MNQADDIVGELVEELTPVNPLPKPIFRALSWAVISFGLVFLLMYLWQPFRAGFAVDLLSSPSYLLEISLGVFAVLSLALGGFVLAVPGAKELRAVKGVSLLSLTTFFIVLFVNYSAPALAPSMAGKREHCVVEGIVYGIFLLGTLLILLRRSGIFEQRLAGLYAGMGAGLIPFVLMQLSCMYIPSHMLTHHLLPALGVAVVAFVFSKYLLPRP